MRGACPKAPWGSQVSLHLALVVQLPFLQAGPPMQDLGGGREPGDLLGPRCWVGWGWETGVEPVLWLQGPDQP